MRFYLVAQDPAMLKTASRTGFIEGVYLDKRAIQKTGRDESLLMQEAYELGFSFVALQAGAFDATAISEQAKNLLQGVAQPFTLFMPMTFESLKAAKRLTELGVKPGIGYICTVAQALVAARAGAQYVMLEHDRLSQYGIDTVSLARAITSAFTVSDTAVKVIVDGVKSADLTASLAMCGIHAVVCSFDVIQTLVYHPVTDLCLEAMLTDANLDMG